MMDPRMAASTGGMDLKALSQMDPKLLQAVGIDPKMFDPKTLADHQHAPPLPLHQPAKVLQLPTSATSSNIFLPTSLFSRNWVKVICKAASLDTTKAYDPVTEKIL